MNLVTIYLCKAYRIENVYKWKFFGSKERQNREEEMVVDEEGYRKALSHHISPLGHTLLKIHEDVYHTHPDQQYKCRWRGTEKMESHGYEVRTYPATAITRGSPPPDACRRRAPANPMRTRNS